MSQKSNPILYLWAVLTNRCPRCREGKVFITKHAYDFKNNLKMHEFCPVCGQPSEIEVGFYYGTSYVSYLLTVVYTALTFVCWWMLLGFSLYDNSIFYWLGVNGVTLLLLQPYFMRLSRSLWLSWFVKYDADWKQNKLGEFERVVKEQMNNW